MKAQPPFAAREVQSGSQVRCLPPRQPSGYGRDCDDVEPDRDAWHSPAALLIRRNTVATVSKHAGVALSKISPLASWPPLLHFPPAHGTTQEARGTSDSKSQITWSNMCIALHLDVCINAHAHLLYIYIYIYRSSLSSVSPSWFHCSHYSSFSSMSPWTSKTTRLPPLGWCFSEKTELLNSPRIQATRHWKQLPNVWAK